MNKDGGGSCYSTHNSPFKQGMDNGFQRLERCEAVALVENSAFMSIGKNQ